MVCQNICIQNPFWFYNWLVKQTPQMVYKSSESCWRLLELMKADIEIFFLLMILKNALVNKSVIDRKRPTCQNNNSLNAQQYRRSTLFFRSVVILCFRGLFAVLGKAKYHIDHYAPVKNGSQVRVGTDERTDGRTDGTKHIISPASRSITKSITNSSILWQDTDCLVPRR